MSPRDPEGPTTAEVVNEAGAWLAAGGILTLALAPLALPFLLLTVPFVLPLLLIPLAGAALVAVVALPLLVAFRVGRRVIAAARSARPARSRTALD